MALKISGTSIASPHVDASKTYRNGAAIINLEAGGRLAPADERVANRIDGILANRPADGRIDIDELVEFEQNPFTDAQDKAALPGIWSALELPAVASVPAPARPAALQVLETRPPAAEAKESDQIPIAAMRLFGLGDANSYYGQLVRRVQGGLNSDGRADTFSLGDLDRARSPQYARYFTRADLDGLGTIAAAVRRWNAEWNARGLRGEVALPADGRSEHAIPGAEALPIRLISQTSTQRDPAGRPSEVSRRWDVVIQCPPGVQVSVTNLDTGRETYLGTGGRLNAEALPPGKYRIESAQVLGRTLQQLDVEIPDVRAWDEKVSLAAFGRHDFVVR